MNGKHYVVQGAICQCKLSETPVTDILQVKTQSKHFANDSEGKEKLIVTDKEIGQSMQKNTFGNCTMQMAAGKCLPCQVNITQWKGVDEKVTYSNKGKALLEDSKATCIKGVPDCIIIVNHGQTAALTDQNFENSSSQILSELLPGINLSDLEDEILKINNQQDE
jgi:hypothetical protein